jgi:hypothetical protein
MLMLIRNVTLTAGIVFVFCGVAYAQPQQRVAIEVTLSAADNDRIGPMVAAEIKELLARSARFRLGDEPFFGGAISIISLVPDSAPNMAALSVMFEKPLFCSSNPGCLEDRTLHAVQTVGRDVTDRVAKALLADYVLWWDREKCRK